MWIYAFMGIDAAGNPIISQVAHWGAEVTPAPTLRYYAAVNCAGCLGADGYTHYQIALVGKADDTGTTNIYIVGVVPGDMMAPVFTPPTIIPLKGGDLYTAAWLPANTNTTNNCMCKNSLHHLNRRWCLC